MKLINFFIVFFVFNPNLISVDSSGFVKFYNCNFNCSLKRAGFEKTVGKASRVYTYQKGSHTVLIYDSIGIRTSATKSKVDSSLIRDFEIFYKTPFKTAPKNPFADSLRILNTAVSSRITFSRLKNDSVFSAHRIFYETTPKDLLQLSYEIKINETYINFHFGEGKDSTLTSVSIEPCKQYVK